MAVTMLTGIPSVTLSGGQIGRRLGAPVDRQDYGTFALWAADCAEHVLPRFEEERPRDDRPHTQQVHPSITIGDTHGDR